MRMLSRALSLSVVLNRSSSHAFTFSSSRPISVSLRSHSHSPSLPSSQTLRHFTSPSHLNLQSTPSQSSPSTLYPNVITGHPNNNISPTIASKIGQNLHLKPNHPLNTIKVIIEKHFNSTSDAVKFEIVDNLPPIVTTQNCFDDLLIPFDHPGRSPSDTYYLDDLRCLRTHTSAHQSTLMKSGKEFFLCTGDVYRRDEVDVSHYPIFHQMEGVKLFPLGTPRKEVEDDLKEKLTGLARTLFGDVEMRWSDSYFPFTDPSFELEILYNGSWLEVLGSGVIEQKIITSAGQGDRPGWAFGLGLERLAMVLFKIPDIRLFWSRDPRFLSQFERGGIVEFVSFSKYPFCYKDISFYTSEKGAKATFHPNDLYEIVRGVSGSEEDLIEKIELIDEFANVKSGQVSNCFRITYRSMERSLTNEEVDGMQDIVRNRVVSELGVVLR